MHVPSTVPARGPAGNLLPSNPPAARTPRTTATTRSFSTDRAGAPTVPPVPTENRRRIAALIAAACAAAAVAFTAAPAPENPAAYAYRQPPAATGDTPTGSDTPSRGHSRLYAATATPAAAVGDQGLYIQPIVNVLVERVDQAAVNTQLNRISRWLTTVSDGRYRTHVAAFATPVYTDTSDCDTLVTIAEDRYRDAVDNGTLADATYVALLDTDNCDWSGLAGVNSNWLYVAGFDGRQFSSGTFVHELGHTLGLPHAGSQTCDETSCTYREYGDSGDPMGQTVDELPDSFGPVNLRRLGWLNPDAVETIPFGASRTVTLAEGGTELIRVGDHALTLARDNDGHAKAVVIDQLADTKRPWDLRVHAHPARPGLTPASHWVSDDGTVAVHVTAASTTRATVHVSYGSGQTDRWAPWGTVTLTRTRSATIVDTALVDVSTVTFVTIAVHFPQTTARFFHNNGKATAYLTDDGRGAPDRITVTALDGAGNLRVLTATVAGPARGRPWRLTHLKTPPVGATTDTGEFPSNTPPPAGSPNPGTKAPS